MQEVLTWPDYTLHQTKTPPSRGEFETGQVDRLDLIAYLILQTFIIADGSENESQLEFVNAVAASTVRKPGRA